MESQEPRLSAARSTTRSSGVPADDRTPEELALDAQRGSCDAFGRLVVRFQRSLYTFLLVRTKSREDAEELTQEAFLQAWRKIDRYRPHWKFSTWLFALARRLALSHNRRSRHTASVETMVEISHDGGDPFGAACAREESVLLWRTAVSVLSAEQRSALWLRYAEDLSIDEVAQVLGKLKTTVRVLLFRGRERLAAEMRRAGDSECVRDRIEDRRPPSAGRGVMRTEMS